MKKKIVISMVAFATVAAIAFAEVTYCVTVKCSMCGRTYGMMNVSGDSQSDCEEKAKKFVCGHNSLYKKAISAVGYCPKID